jgi:hypothetical protein
LEGCDGRRSVNDLLALIIGVLFWCQPWAADEWPALQRSDPADGTGRAETNARVRCQLLLI